MIDESRSAHAARVDAVGATAPPAERGAGAASPSASATLCLTSLCEITLISLCKMPSISLCEMAMARSSPVWKTCGKVWHV